MNTKITIAEWSVADTSSPEHHLNARAIVRALDECPSCPYMKASEMEYDESLGIITLNAKKVGFKGKSSMTFIKYGDGDWTVEIWSRDLTMEYEGELDRILQCLFKEYQDTWGT